MTKVIDGILVGPSRTRFNGTRASSRDLRLFTVIFVTLAALWCFTMTHTTIPATYFPPQDDPDNTYTVHENAAIAPTANHSTSTGVDDMDSIADTRTKPEPVLLPPAGATVSTTKTAGGVLRRDTPTFVISCGTQVTDAVGEMVPLLTSMLAFLSGSLRLVFLTDTAGSARIDALFSEELVHYKRRIEVNIMVVPDKTIEDFAYRVRLDPYGDRTGRWAIAKLMVPWLLPEYNRVIVVDTDMIFMDDPLEVWKEHGHNDGHWVYRMPLNARHSNNDICSCIVLFNLRRARNLHVYPRLFKRAFLQILSTNKKERLWYSGRKKLWRPDHGDQGVYWLLMAAYPRLFSALPQKWNREKCHNYSWLFKQGSKVDVGILHRNCGGTDSRTFNDTANHQFDFFLNFKWHWLKASPADGGFKVDVFHTIAPAMPTS